MGPDMTPRITARSIATVCIAWIAIGCGQTQSDAAKPAIKQPLARHAAAEGPLDHAQPRLPVVRLRIGPITLETEVASRNVDIQTGMMFRDKMEDTEGMIFMLQPSPQRAAFWMRNTRVPLSCAYIDSAGRILEIHDLQPLDETPVVSGSDQISYVLEVPQGWFQRHQVEIGTFIRTETGTLGETLKRR